MLSCFKWCKKPTTTVSIETPVTLEPSRYSQSSELSLNVSLRKTSVVETNTKNNQNSSVQTDPIVDPSLACSVDGVGATNNDTNNHQSAAVTIPKSGSIQPLPGHTDSIADNWTEL